MESMLVHVKCLYLPLLHAVLDGTETDVLFLIVVAVK